MIFATVTQFHVYLLLGQRLFRFLNVIVLVGAFSVIVKLQTSRIVVSSSHTKPDHPCVQDPRARAAPRRCSCPRPRRRPWPAWPSSSCSSRAPPPPPPTSTASTPRPPRRRCPQLSQHKQISSKMMRCELLVLSLDLDLEHLSEL